MLFVTFMCVAVTSISIVYGLDVSLVTCNSVPTHSPLQYVRYGATLHRHCAMQQLSSETLHKHVSFCKQWGVSGSGLLPETVGSGLQV
jgi:hypothetical protein